MAGGVQLRDTASNFLDETVNINKHEIIKSAPALYPSLHPLAVCLCAGLGVFFQSTSSILLPLFITRQAIWYRTTDNSISLLCM